MNQASTASISADGASSAQELFALTDEQILEIEPVAQDVGGAAGDAETDGQLRESEKADSSRSLGMTTPSPENAEPPAWLAAQMKDPWAGEEARELWEGVQRAQAEASEYKQVFERPEAARAAAERARALDEFDAAYFGVVGKSTEETSAARRALAQRMLREDPAAFRRMVAAGIEALRQAGESNVAHPLTAANAAPAETVPVTQQGDGLKSAPTQPLRSENTTREAQLAAYSEFEKAANQDLEKSVGATIERALQQALPNAGHSDSDGLKLRLATSVRQEIEKALQGDRQLGEQVAQVLSARRFDETARAQVVRLINERAQQLVPSATKRVLHDWTQTTLAAHRSKTEKQETAGNRADLAPIQQGRERTVTGSQQRTSRVDAPPASRGRIDYKKLSDEQILDL